MSKKITAVLTRSLGHIQLEFEDGTSEIVTREANAGQDLKVGDWYPAPETPTVSQEIKPEAPAPEAPAPEAPAPEAPIAEQAAQPSNDPIAENEAQKPAEEEATQLFDSIEEEAQPKKKKK